MFCTGHSVKLRQFFQNCKQTWLTYFKQLRQKCKMDIGYVPFSTVRVCLVPVEKWPKTWSGLAVARSTWLVRHTSLYLFFSCSLCMISSSFWMLHSRSIGHWKNEANRLRASSKCSLGTSKWKFVCSEVVYALEEPPRWPKKAE